MALIGGGADGAAHVLTDATEANDTELEGDARTATRHRRGVGSTQPRSIGSSRNKNKPKKNEEAPTMVRTAHEKQRPKE